MGDTVTRKKAHSDSSLRNSIKRRFVVIHSHGESESNENATPITSSTSRVLDSNVLVVNSSFAMAKEITLAITLKMPLCSIMYAPGLEVAGWLLKRRKIDVVVASPMLPDGGIEKLLPICEMLDPPPDVVIVGKAEAEQIPKLAKFGNTHDSKQYFKGGFKKVHTELLAQKDDNVKRLGADIRNDINNPLQEIVAMIYVAKAGRELSPVTVEALEAIDRAAQGIATTVKGIEDRLRTSLPG